MQSDANPQSDASPQPDANPLSDSNPPDASPHPERPVHWRKRLQQARQVVQQVAVAVLRGLTSALCSVLIEGAFDL
jgi:hypothetical protein